MEKVSIGSVEVTALLDAPFLQNPKVLAPDNAEQLIAEFGADLDERGLFMGAVTCYLVRSGGTLVLVDTGIGPRKRPGFPAGHLDEALRAAGVSPGEIDAVIHTHLHIDHVGWNTFEGAGGEPEVWFPNAQFVVQQAEWDYWMAPEMLADEHNLHLRQCMEPLRHSRRLVFTQGEESYGEHLVFISAPGHTPGHVAVGISDRGERGVIIGDASHHPMQVTHPEWRTMEWDWQMAARSRDRLFEIAAEDGRLVVGGHWKHPGWGHVVRLEGKRSFRAL